MIFELFAITCLLLTYPCVECGYADPPKVAADVVESLIGAVYMDSGFAAAMEAVIRIVSPMLKILQQMYAKNERFVMMHPRKAMQEIGGSLFVMKVAKEEKFAAQVCLAFFLIIYL